MINERREDSGSMERQAEVVEVCSLIQAYVQGLPHLSVTRSIAQLLQVGPQGLYTSEDCDISAAIRAALDEDL